MALTKEESDKLAKLEKLTLLIDANYTSLFPAFDTITVDNAVIVLLALYYEDCKIAKAELKAKV